MSGTVHSTSSSPSNPNDDLIIQLIQFPGICYILYTTTANVTPRVEH
jgi:hypothetical protein